VYVCVCLRVTVGMSDGWHRGTEASGGGPVGALVSRTVPLLHLIIATLDRPPTDMRWPVTTQRHEMNSDHTQRHRVDLSAALCCLSCCAGQKLDTIATALQPSAGRAILDVLSQDYISSPWCIPQEIVTSMLLQGTEVKSDWTAHPVSWWFSKLGFNSWEKGCFSDVLVTFLSRLYFVNVTFATLEEQIFWPTMHPNVRHHRCPWLLGCPCPFMWCQCRIWP